MNVLPETVIADIHALAAKGYGLRATARALGIAKGTCGRYYPKHTAKCQCGRAAGHSGWCDQRIAQSASRQEYLENCKSGVNAKVVRPPEHKLSRLNQRRKTTLRWLGIEGKCEPVSRIEQYSIIGEVYHATRSFPSELVEDVRHDVILRAFEGRVQRSEIERAAVFFLRRAAAYLYREMSMDAFLDEDGELNLHGVLASSVTESAA